MTLKLADIKAKLAHIDNEADIFLQALLNDPRKNVQQLATRHVKQLQQRVRERQSHAQRLEIENGLYASGQATLIAGVDEVGRGPLAGPVVTAAVILPRECDALIGVNDSKQLSHAKRCEFDALIRKIAIAIHIDVCDVATIDTLNIYQATRQSMLRAVQGLSVQPDHLLIDAMTLDTAIPQQSLIKGDQRSLSIAAASIVAKVYRDALMTDYAKKYPEFGFDKHMGYGTKQHLTALETYGYTPIHRKSFAPIANMTHLYSHS
ncbi:MAG: ribonuclease HII [Aerococcaceae bacterium]|nr:ribonuclease HII [Aerococcaceae bacterium]